ncbi:MAG: heat-inducible transcription repressor HrcA [Phascolarctobacterium sp.]|jgi:heat-inducible transcriptional repressor|nr:heat-inducible transcription repressor HrcA [Phascolarctobacterium sp.]MBQ5673095.1 heat-inducible transcription repressor HrcA [Phascolarctobacterium sp.]MBR4847318.1 heat-inducible transcription repressor HrcA [Phascolarctobacterium sp.]MBR5589581.1 heat-inducible transcription repressor HrcA [Phascolarctobacterium sp.]MBR6511722.1 heat-inducible transcription repressor HrcA [Phascolarctobacterium sp.]
MLNDRKKKILQLIIEDYISTAEPVGSRTIARKYDLGISPATIRNEMSDLELLGYLEQPHTSAGRIPSAQAYRFYVDSLIEPGSLTDNDMALINGWYKERRRSIDDIFQSTAKILSRMTQNVSMVLANKDTSAVFRYIKFLPLDNTHAILCIVTDDGNIDNCVVEIPLGMRPEEMDYLAGRISRVLEGKELSEISDELLSALHMDVAEDKVLFTSFLQAIKRMNRKQNEQRVFLGGTKQLLNQPEFRDVERVKSLLGILEEEKVVRDLLVAGEDSGLKITIGTENKFTGIQDCSMVQATYRLNGKIVGTMAVLGPTRMEYGKVITVMDYLHKYLKTMFEQDKE